MTTPSLLHPLWQPIASRIEHAKRGAMGDLHAPEDNANHLALRRLKKWRWVLRDAMGLLGRDLRSPEMA